MLRRDELHRKSLRQGLYNTIAKRHQHCNSAITEQPAYLAEQRKSRRIADERGDDRLLEADLVGKRPHERTAQQHGGSQHEEEAADVFLRDAQIKSVEDDERVHAEE